MICSNLILVTFVSPVLLVTHPVSIKEIVIEYNRVVSYKFVYLRLILILRISLAIDGLSVPFL